MARTIAEVIHAKDISDVEMLRVVAAINDPSGARRWALTYDLDEALPSFPRKVVLAKARQLIKRGLLDGCGCGCRGDFEITAKGRELLDAA